MRQPDRRPFALPTIIEDRGYARVKLGGQLVHLGRLDDPGLRSRYDQAVSSWLNNDRKWPIGPEVQTVCDLVRHFGKKHDGVYAAPAGKGKGPEILKVQRLADLLECSRHGMVGVDELTPLDLEEFAAHLNRHPDQPWARSTINEFVAMVKRVYRWGVKQGLADHATLQKLRTADGLRAGRRPEAGDPKPRESRPIEDVPRDVVIETRRWVHRMVRLMIDVQLLTGMRPCELCGMRVEDLRTVPGRRILEYRVRPEVMGKVERFGIERSVYLGRRAIAFVELAKDGAGEGHVFNPQRAAEWSRATPLSKRTRRCDRLPRRLAKDHYTSESYRAHIARACEEGGIPRWTPYQIRHAYCTQLEEREGIFAAAAALGHTKITTTQIYTHNQRRRAIAIAERSRGAGV